MADQAIPLPAQQNAKPAQKVRDQRGASVSAFSVALIPVFILTTGLAVDGSAQLRAVRQAESVAALAVRAATDSAAGHRAAGLTDTQTIQHALAAARNVLAGHPDLQSTVELVDGQVRVEIKTSAPTLFLSLAGIDALPAQGAASAWLWND